MQYIILSTILAFIISYFSIPVIIQIAKSKKLFDEPDERKLHKSVIPTLGGLGIFAGFIIALAMCVPEGAVEIGKLKYIIAAALVIFFVGLKDDILILSASKKFLGQLVAAGIIMRFGGIYLNNMHGFLGIYEIPHVASVFLTIFTVVVITNSFNLIDGVDGLAGSLGLFTSILFAVYFYFSSTTGGYSLYSVMAASLAGGIIAFLIYNFSPAKIFMGDTGSLMLGLINAVLVIKFINVAPTVTVSGLQIINSPVVGFAVLMIPLFDTLRVFGYRILNRRSPFSPDRNHIHHYLIDLGLSHKQVVFSLLGAAVFFVTVAFFLRSANATLGMLILMALGFSFVGFIYLRKKSIRKAAVMEDEIIVSGSITRKSKIISLAGKAVEVE
jgi:UDP-GlcNAc:undecaprenyl-phosphate/decaprenyl-phosphate GlcNAc-1-phosphate transferase